MFRSKIERFFREVEVKTFKHIKGVTASEKTSQLQQCFKIVSPCKTCFLFVGYSQTI